ncbi:MAG: hypothetical protein JOY90_19695 [Bradyrhizobium sp.]|uniref:hypothetical protein n=1 Tax=Bradyrhizobium sp. TaxID=376 RepID=UPI001D4E3A20|nr:hypothetical protein [Bradyrhizobium sp.]MBV9562640.1 hypothetical protein [Bradyrhizobium sp.]
MMGFAIGTVFRLRMLLPILVLLLLLSILFALAGGFSFFQAVLLVVAVQAIVQSGYFAGLVARAVLAGILRE